MLILKCLLLSVLTGILAGKTVVRFAAKSIGIRPRRVVRMVGFMALFWSFLLTVVGTHAIGGAPCYGFGFIAVLTSLIMMETRFTDLLGVWQRLVIIVLNVLALAGLSIYFAIGWTVVILTPVRSLCRVLLGLPSDPNQPLDCACEVRHRVHRELQARIDELEHKGQR